MQKNYKTPSTKFFLFLFLSFYCISSFAQTSYTIGTGTTTNTSTGYPTPFGDRYEGTRAQYLYRASDLTAAGMLPGLITAIKFNVASLNSTAGIHENYTISIAATAVADLSTSTWEPGTSVIWGPVNYQPVLGMNTFTLSTPFLWNGTSNILIEVCHGDLAPSSSTTTYTYNASVAYTSVSYNANHTYRADNVVGCGNTTTSQTGTATDRPNITFDVITCTPITGLVANNVQKFSATLNWAAGASSILGYEYVLDQFATDPTGMGTLITTNTYSAAGLMAGTTYYFHVRTKCNSTSYSQWKTVSFTTPICKSVDDLKISGITDHSVQLDWSNVSVASSYEYIITTEGSLPPGQYIPVTSTTISKDGLKPYTLYNVFIRSRCTGNDSSIWRQYTFTTSAQCTPPIMTASNISLNEWKVEWPDAPSAIAYEYALAGLNTPTFGITIYTNNVIVSLPDDKAPYYVYARTKCDNIFSTSPWASIMLRDGKGLSVANTQTENIRLYPNPVNDKFMLNIGDNINKNGTLSISDLSGKIILSAIIDKTVSEIDMSQFPSGTYFVKYANNFESQVLKINKL